MWHVIKQLQSLRLSRGKRITSIFGRAGAVVRKGAIAKYSQLGVLVIVSGLATRSAQAHLLQYFTLLRTERQIDISDGQIEFTYRCRLEPTLLQNHLSLLDEDGDGTASLHERSNFFLAAGQYLRDDLAVVLNGAPARCSEESFYVNDEGSAYQTVLTANLPTPAPEVLTISIVDPAFFPPAGTAQNDSRTTSGIASCDLPGFCFAGAPGTGRTMDINRDAFLSISVVKRGKESKHE